MKFAKEDYTESIRGLILSRQNKTVIRDIEIILPKQGYKMTYKERLKDAQKKAEMINNLILN